MFERLNYANVVATLALFVALGSGAYAASKIGSNDIARNAVLSKHIGKDQVRGSDVKESSLKGIAPLGYAHIINNHVVNSESQGVTLKPDNAAGLFCVAVKGHPKHVQATPEDDGGGLVDVNASLAVDESPYNGCPAGTDAGVITGDNNDTFLDQGFFILFY